MIVFKNPGMMNLKLLKTFGASVKITQNPHGMFGSGAKHAIGQLLRTGHKITLYRGLDRYDFIVKPATVRGKEFSFVHLVGNGEDHELPFTTDMGRTFQTWGSYRELAANAYDENGTVESFGSRLFGRRATYTPKPNETAIVVEGEEIEEAYRERDKIFLSSTPFYSDDNLEVHRGLTKYVYYRGVRVFEFTSELLYTYNLRQLRFTNLTEDRTLASSHGFLAELAWATSRATDKEFIRTIVTANPTVTESRLDDHWGPVSDEFKAVYAELRRDGYASSLTSFANSVYKRTVGKLPLPDPVSLTRIQKQQLDKAIAFCKTIGYEVDSYPIVVLPAARDGLLALAENGTIYLTVALFDKGTKYVALGVIEEYAHLKHGFYDESRSFQTWLFEQMMNLGERLTGEPL